VQRKVFKLTAAELEDLALHRRAGDSVLAARGRRPIESAKGRCRVMKCITRWITLTFLAACLHGCFLTNYAQLWSSSEVVLVGQRRPSSAEFPPTLLLNIKNVAGKQDGLYSVAVIGSPIEGPAATSTSTQAPSGGSSLELAARIGDLAVPYPWMLTYAEAVELDLGDVTSGPTSEQPDSSQVEVAAGEFGVRILRDDGDFIDVEIYEFDGARKSWAYVGRQAIGEGEQWSLRRGVGAVSLPLTLILDGVLIPVYPLAFLFAGS
jgi:hypothetical protein